MLAVVRSYLLCSVACCSFAQSTLVDETFANGIPGNFLIQQGTTSISDGVLTLTSGCIRLGTASGQTAFSRAQGLVVEADITLAGLGDFNVWGLYDTFRNGDCHAGPLNGYYTGWYAAGSDNPEDQIDANLNGISARIATTPVRISAGTRYRVRQEFLPDGTIRTYINNVLTMSAVDMTRTSGFLTLRTWGSVAVDNVLVKTISGGPPSRTFVAAFTGFLNSAGNGTGAYGDDVSALLADGRGMTNLVATIRTLPELASVQARAFTFYTGNGNDTLAPLSDDEHHAEAEAWLRNVAPPLTAADRIIIVGHSYGGHRARRFAEHVVRENIAPAVDTLVTIDPIDWTRCGIVPAFLTLGCESALRAPCPGAPLACAQTAAESRPANVRNVLTYYQRRNPALQGYPIEGSNGPSRDLQDLGVGHMQTDDALTVHRDVLNTMLTTPLSVVPLRGVYRLTREQAKLRLDVSVANPNRMYASGVSLTGIRLDGVAPFDPPRLDSTILGPGQISSPVTRLFCTESIVSNCVTAAPGSSVMLVIEGTHAGGSFRSSWRVQIPR